MVVFTWASTCSAGVVVVHVAAMQETVVPVLETFYRQGGEATWGLMSNVAAAISAAVAATVAAAADDVATAVCVATAAAIVAATANVVAVAACRHCGHRVAGGPGCVQPVGIVAVAVGACWCRLPGRAFEAAPASPRCWRCSIIAVLWWQRRLYQNLTLHL